MFLISCLDKRVHYKTGRPLKIIGALQDISSEKIRENNLKELGENLNLGEKVAGMGSWKYNATKNEIFWSDEIYRIYDLKPEEFGGTVVELMDFTYPEDRAVLQELTRKRLAHQKFDLQYRILLRNGTIKHLRLVGEPIKNRDGVKTDLVGTIQDITEIKAFEQALRNKETEIDEIQQRTKMLIQESGVVFEIITADGVIRYISDTSQKVINYDPDSMIGKSVYDYYDHQEAEYLRALIQRTMATDGGTETGIISFAGKDGKPIYLEVHIQNFLDHPIIQGLVLDFRDVTNRIIMQRKIEKLASYDEITSLPKPNQFKKELTEKCRKASRDQHSLIVLMMDFEGFKEINDTLGQQVGQQLIVQIVMRLRGLFGKDTLIARYSEDQFAIVIEGLFNLDAYEARVIEVFDFFYRPFKIDIYEFNVNVNTGVSVYPLEKPAKDGEIEDDWAEAEPALDEIEALIQYANIALVWSKKEGKNQYRFYSSKLNIENYKQLQLRHDLRMAVKRDQFMVFYQPMVRMKNNEILAVEALIRWNHPDWGIVSPEEFIFLAEETGAIVEMGKWMLRKICEDHRYWMMKGYKPVYISVNFSSVQFYERDFVKNITAVLAEFEVDPKYLIVELTESLMIENSHKAIADIEALQRAGIKVALDDFGTGYSSLSYLKLFNIDIVKMDASFLKDIISNKTTAILALAIINLTKELRIKLVCEGIENWEQLSFLKENNCVLGQGYIYSRPVPFLKIDEMLENGRCRPLLNKETSKARADRRKYFRQEFNELLMTDLTILKIKDKNLSVGNSKALIKDIGPGGLCFISNIQFPLERDFTLEFTTTLLGKEISTVGTPVRFQEVDDNLFEYGVQFTMDDSATEELMRILFEVQVKMKKNILFADGSFTSKTASHYFYELSGGQSPEKVDFSKYKKKN